VRELYWLLESRCNYPCPYCPYHGAERERLVAAQPPLTAQAWVRAWERLAGRAGRCKVYISGGGEPTLRPDFTALVAGLARHHDVVFDTNLSWSRERLAEFAAAAPAAAVRVEASLHPSAARVDEFLDKAAYLKSRGFRVHGRWVAWPPDAARLPELAGAFRARGVAFSPTPFSGEWEGRSYPAAYAPREREAFAAAARDSAAAGHEEVDPALVRHLALLHEERPAGRPCRAGADYACVMPDGTVHRCVQYGMRGWEPAGSLLDGSWTPAPGPAPCRAELCAHEWRWLLREDAAAA
jgi:MoaA/NifB/PqqE/SkfB family radical SAM enzyme